VYSFISSANFTYLRMPAARYHRKVNLQTVLSTWVYQGDHADQAKSFLRKSSNHLLITLPTYAARQLVTTSAAAKPVGTSMRTPRAWAGLVHLE
jgi:hypothetical protein